MAKIVQRNTFVYDDEGLRYHLLAGTELKGDFAWAEKKITNPKVFIKPGDEEVNGPNALEEKPNTPPVTQAAVVTPPPRHGAGSGKDAWVEYFNRVTESGVELEGDETKDEIIKWLEDNHLLDHERK